MPLRQISKRAENQLLHLRNRGIQCCRLESLDTLAPFQIQVSMTKNSNPLKNASAERVSGILQAGVAKPAAGLLVGGCGQRLEQARASWGPLERRWKNSFKSSTPVSVE